VSLDWAMMFMTEFPETQKKCQDEIEKVSHFYTKLVYRSTDDSNDAHTYIH